MFAPPVAKLKKKSARPQLGAIVLQRHIQSEVGGLLAQHASVTRNEPGARKNEDNAARVTGLEAAPSWDFSKISVFPPGRAERFQIPPHLPAPRLLCPIQATLEVGAVDDPLEHEANRVADQVMRMPAPQLQRACSGCGGRIGASTEEKEGEPTIRRSAQVGAEHIEAPDSIVARLGAVRPLDPGVRSFFEPRFGVDFGAVQMPPALQPSPQAKAVIPAATAALEQEADQIAAQLSPAAAHSMSAAPLQISRKCACCADDETPQLKAAGSQPAAGAARGGVQAALTAPGQPLDAQTRAFFEPRFGEDFGAVRVRTGAAAEQSARELNAYAYTVGRDIVFAAGRFAPATDPGRRLLAHELTHVVQQARGDLALQCFVPCTRARLSLEECPQREPGEERAASHDPMIIEYITSPEVGFLVANFDIRESKLKPSAMRHLNWPLMIKTISEPNSQWEIKGLSDCHGTEELNKLVRQQRANAVRAILPPAAAVHIVGASGVDYDECITDNENLIAREWNRSVLIMPVKREITIEPDEIEGKRPVPKPVDQPTADCNDKQDKELAAAQPIAVDMVRKALLALRDQQNPTVKALLRKYFNDDSATTFAHAHDGLLTTLQGLTSGIKLECETKGSFMYDHFCPESSTEVTTAYVRRHVGFRVHLCEAAFGRSDLNLAATLVHECSHLFDNTKDKLYCWKDCSKLDPEDAYDNADSYAGFVREAYTAL
jgi:hypothetical protein